MVGELFLSFTKFVCDMYGGGDVYGEVHGFRCSINIHSWSAFSSLDAHIALPVEELNVGWGAKSCLHPQFSLPGGDALVNQHHKHTHSCLKQLCMWCCTIP